MRAFLRSLGFYFYTTIPVSKPASTLCKALNVSEGNISLYPCAHDVAVALVYLTEHHTIVSITGCIAIRYTMGESFNFYLTNFA